MRIATRDIPQADDLHAVLKVVDAVAGGATTYQAAAHAIGMVERQGRYYRRAAEIIGLLVESSGSNFSELTPLGLEYARAAGPAKRTIAVSSVLSARVFQRVIPFLESKLPDGCRPQDLRRFLGDVTQPTGKTMMPRRAATIIGWLRALDLVVVSQDRYVLCTLPGELPAITYTHDGEPLLPENFTLAEYQEVEKRIRAERGDITHIIDENKVERANDSHRVLTNLVAGRIRSAGGIPRCNDLVDLAAKLAGMSFIFEVKSTTTHNARTQIRKGISQLYEYRYLQRAPDAKLVLVVENPLGKDLAWMADYIANDRGIFLVWDGDRKHLYCDNSLKPTLEFLCA